MATGSRLGEKGAMARTIACGARAPCDGISENCWKPRVDLRSEITLARGSDVGGSSNLHRRQVLEEDVPLPALRRVRRLQPVLRGKRTRECDPGEGRILGAIGGQPLCRAARTSAAVSKDRDRPSARARSSRWLQSSQPRRAERAPAPRPERAPPRSCSTHPSRPAPCLEGRDRPRATTRSSRDPARRETTAPPGGVIR